MNAAAYGLHSESFIRHEFDILPDIKEILLLVSSNKALNYTMANNQLHCFNIATFCHRM